jgi:hypothetical protein
MYRVFPSSTRQARQILVHSWRVLYVVDDTSRRCDIVAVVHIRADKKF